MSYLARLNASSIALAVAIAVSPALAQTTTDTSTDDGTRKFDDSQLLIDTLMADDAAQLEDDLQANASEIDELEVKELALEGDVSTAQQSFDDAFHKLDPTSDEATLLQNAIAAGDALAEAEAREQELKAKEVSPEGLTDDEKTELETLQGDGAGSVNALTEEKATTDGDVAELAELAEGTDKESAAAALALQNLESAEQELAEAKENTETAKADGEALQADFDAELEKITQLVEGGDAVEGMTEEQIFAFNRALNNAVSSGLLADIDFESFEDFFDEDGNLIMTRQQINAFTKAYESEAKFLQIAERTGQVEKFETKAESQKDKFLNKAAGKKPGRGHAIDGTDALSLAKASASQASKGVAKGAAKAAAKQAAKQAAKTQAKSSAKGAAKNAAKQTAKQVAKEEAREKGKAKGKNKNS